MWPPNYVVLWTVVDHFARGPHDFDSWRQLRCAALHWAHSRPALRPLWRRLCHEHAHFWRHAYRLYLKLAPTQDSHPLQVRSLR